MSVVWSSFWLSTVSERSWVVGLNPIPHDFGPPESKVQLRWPWAYVYESCSFKFVVIRRPTKECNGVL